MLMVSLVQQFKVFLQVIPARKWSGEVFKGKFNLLDLHRIQGEIEVDLRTLKSLMGTFKTAHPSQILMPTVDIPACFAGKICVKQVYQKKSSGTIGHMRGKQEHAKILQELICLDWGAILLDLTYQFVEEAAVEYGNPPGEVPSLRFVRTMLAEDHSNEKSFLVEEWIDNGAGFVKYINNGHPVACVQPDAPKEDHEIAEFLCFAQHVQFNETNGLAYTSDYQGL